MPKCQVCNNDNMSFTEIWKGKTMCSECEKNGRKVPPMSKIKGAFVLFILFFGVYQCGKCSKTDTPKMERIEQDNGQVQYKHGEELVWAKPKKEKGTTLYKIPDLVSYTVYSRFLEAGFNDMGKDIGKYGCFWTYNYEDDKGMYYLRVYGNNPNEVQVIDASFTGESIKAAKFYLTEVAKTNYTGSNSDEAERFISKNININRNTQTKIGGIGFWLISKPTFKALKIGIDEENIPITPQ
jgi:hypothetical protein